MKTNLGTDIPDDLIALIAPDNGLENRLALLNSLIQPANAGELIKLAALAEEEISTFLARYLAHSAHANDNATKIGKNATFDQKIQALNHILPKLDADQTHYEGHIQFLNALRKLRNTAAHSSGLDLKDAKKHASDPMICSITANFPNALWEKVTALRDYLLTLPL